MHNGALLKYWGPLPPLNFSPTPLDSAEMAAVFKKASNLPQDAYDALLVYLQATGHQYRAYDAFPHPSNALILPPTVELPLQVPVDMAHPDGCATSAIWWWHRLLGITTIVVVVVDVVVVVVCCGRCCCCCGMHHIM
ncbi:uncharacterized protein LACBIDRAFT_334088 [Laccaria bicolor S238N-H82]|uniref:Predicted protein n=1 Tax=Laccaria bicolor (strain S238N-H82 / ATCC MYA-4686) TaxID=486041 RepID=B0DY21_LACBS|nr:uncharacterized protein LACBIDRAFT_334088 [Laccaria bicolor S238N-H82]EDR00486.1 predicted protein [Laccaria bicolor S238N-H82]|eukprot:XP_001888878.1 predicted protein [Laccaria bicolor S238N-H82]